MLGRVLRQGLRSPSKVARICAVIDTRLVYGLIAHAPEGPAPPSEVSNLGKCLETTVFDGWVRGYQTDAAEEEFMDVDVSRTAKNVFRKSWERIEAKHGEHLVVPREVVWLNGAPGAGKGASTPYILKSRGLGRAITMSEVLKLYPEAKRLMENGELVPEAMVVDALLDALFDPTQDDGVGVIVDGYPRTEMQADVLRLLFEKLCLVHDQYANSPHAHLRPRPSFKVVVLYVDEKTSIERQQGRGMKMCIRNQKVQDAGTQEYATVRRTDVDVEFARKRYETFKEHYNALFRLRAHFPFHLLDATGDLEGTSKQITKELRYQSSMDLEEETYNAIRHLPMSRELCKISRRQLTCRLDSYAKTKSQQFRQVISLIENEVLPILKRCALAGEAIYNTTNPLFCTFPVSIDMLIDILSDRGFHVSYLRDQVDVPYRLGPETGEFELRTTVKHRFKMTFHVASVRDGVEDLFEGSQESGSGDISTSFVPGGWDHQAKYYGKQAREMLVARSVGQPDQYDSESMDDDHNEEDNEGVSNTVEVGFKFPSSIQHAS